jgi:hypothetical protein
MFLALMGVAMTEEAEPIAFTEVPPPQRGVEAIRLTRRQDEVILAASRTADDSPTGTQTNFSALPVSNPVAGWRSMVDAPMIRGARPRWDVAPDAQQRLQLAFEHSGGAINDLVFQIAGAEAVSIGGDYPGESFGAPRFSRPTGEPQPWVTAIVDDKRCIALPRAGGRYRNLGDADDCMLIGSSPGFLLIAKTNARGSARGNDISPGILRVRRLDDQLRDAGPWFDPLKQTIFEFDADVIGGRIVIAATISGGFVLASLDAGGTTFVAGEYPASGELTSLSMLAHGDRASLGVLDADSSRGTRILLADLPVPTAP